METFLSKADIPALVTKLDTGYYLRQCAAYALGTLGPLGQEAVPKLVECLGDSDAEFRQWVAAALGNIEFSKIPEPSLPDLVAKLKSGDLKSRLRAGTLLGRVVSQYPQAIQALGDALVDPDEKVRAVVLDALGRSCPRSMDILIEALGSEWKDVRAGAANQLRQLGPKAQSAVGPLVEALIKEPTEERWSPFGNALGAIGKAAVPALLRCFKNENPHLRLEAVHQLGLIEEPTQMVLETIIQALDDPALNVCLEALDAIQRFGPKAMSAVPALVRSLNQKEKWLDKKDTLDFREDLVEALAKIGPAAASALPVLLETLKDDDANLRLAVFSAICGLGVEAGPALSELILTLELAFERTDYFRGNYAHELTKLGIFFRSQIKDHLDLLLDNRNSHVKLGALEILNSLQIDCPGPKLVDLFHDPEAAIRAQSAIALSRVPQPETIVPVLVDSLQDPAPEVRYYGAVSLGNIGKSAISALPILLQGMRNWQTLPALGAAFAVYKLAPDNQEALDRLINGLTLEVEYRCAAEPLLAEIGVSVVPSLLAAIKNPHLCVSIHSIGDHVLPLIDNLDIKELVPHIKDFFVSSDPVLVFAAVQMVCSLEIIPQPIFPDVVDYLLKCVVHENSMVADLAASTLCAFGVSQSYEVQ